MDIFSIAITFCLLTGVFYLSYNSDNETVQLRIIVFLLGAIFGKISSWKDAWRNKNG